MFWLITRLRWHISSENPNALPRQMHQDVRTASAMDAGKAMSATKSHSTHANAGCSRFGQCRDNAVT